MKIESKDGILQSLVNYCEKNDKEIETVLADVLTLIPYPRKARLEGELDRSFCTHGRKENSRVDGTKAYNLWATFFHFLYDIDIENLGLDESNPLYKKIRAVDQSRSKSIILQLKQFEGEEVQRQEKIEEYRKTIEFFFSHLKSKLLIYDYMERHQYELEDEGHMYTKKDAYMKVHDGIFENIEHLFTQKNDASREIVYKRYLSLPLRHKYLKDMPTEMEVKTEIVRCTSFPLFKHICRCLTAMPNMGTEIEDSGFYMIAKPTRTYHYAILDNGSHFMAEYYRYNSHEVCKPDILHVGENTQAHQNRIATYQREFEKLRIKEHPKFNLGQLPEILTTLYKQTEMELTQLPANTPNRILKNVEGRIKLLQKKLEFCDSSLNFY